MVALSFTNGVNGLLIRLTSLHLDVVQRAREGGHSWTPNFDLLVLRITLVMDKTFGGRRLDLKYKLLDIFNPTLSNNSVLPPSYVSSRRGYEWAVDSNMKALVIVHTKAWSQCLASIYHKGPLVRDFFSHVVKITWLFIKEVATRR